MNEDALTLLCLRFDAKLAFNWRHFDTSLAFEKI